MSVQDITPVILTHNEEPNIGRVLAQLRWAHSIVVVDSNSTDGTAEVVRSVPQARFIQRPFENHVDQWNFALAQVETPWVLTLDADYVLSDELVNELQERPLSTNEAGYYASFRYCVHGSILRSSLYPPRIVLFQRHRGRYISDGHTQLLEIDGRVGALSGHIYHDDRKTFAAWVDAQRRYAALEAAKLRATPTRLLRPVDRLRRAKWIAPIAVLAYCLIGKGLILDGWPGVYYTFQRAYAELLLSLTLMSLDLAPGRSSRAQTRRLAARP
jgi:glycosyltransferase involved in cell wall biosynthesis